MRRTAVTIAGLCVACATLGACNILGPALYFAHGPEKAPAQFTLPKERPVVVFVDDRANYLPRRSLRLIIASQAGDHLLKAGAVKLLIEPRAAVTASTSEQPGQPLDIVTLGKSVQADVVVYAIVDGFRLSPDGQTFAPAASVRVKVIDVHDPNARVWPAKPEGETVAVQPMESVKDVPRSPAALAAAEERLAAEVGRNIAELFYEHEARRSLSDR